MNHIVNSALKVVFVVSILLTLILSIVYYIETIRVSSIWKIDNTNAPFSNFCEYKIIGKKSYLVNQISEDELTVSLGGELYTVRSAYKTVWYLDKPVEEGTEVNVFRRCQNDRTEILENLLSD